MLRSKRNWTRLRRLARKTLTTTNLKPVTKMRRKRMEVGRKKKRKRTNLAQLSVVR